MILDVPHKAVVTMATRRDAMYSEPVNPIPNEYTKYISCIFSYDTELYYAPY